MNEKTLQPDLESIEKALKNEKQRISRNMFHLPTPPHGIKNRGVGITRKSHAKSPAKRKASKLSRSINQKISNKKFRPSGSKKRK